MRLQDVLWSNRKANPQKAGLVLDDRRITFDTLTDRVNRLASALRRLGLAPGDRVAVLMGTATEYVELYFAVPLALGIIVPMSTQLGAAEASALLEDADARLFIYESDFLRYALESPASSPT